ncbi:hypothetical protein D4R86_01880 [bacterium]|nr:MAG: hypothetical protein D4R86_01880 [bacterium]
MNTQDLKKENQKLRKEIEKLNKLVTIDFLTKLYNRRVFLNFSKLFMKEENGQLNIKLDVLKNLNFH